MWVDRNEDPSTSLGCGRDQKLSDAALVKMTGSGEAAGLDPSLGVLELRDLGHSSCGTPLLDYQGVIVFHLHHACSCCYVKGIGPRRDSVAFRRRRCVAATAERQECEAETRKSDPIGHPKRASAAARQEEQQAACEQSVGEGTDAICGPWLSKGAGAAGGGEGESGRLRGGAGDDQGGGAEGGGNICGKIDAAESDAVAIAGDSCEAELRRGRLAGRRGDGLIGSSSCDGEG